jgi:hypothetical protein
MRVEEGVTTSRTFTPIRKTSQATQARRPSLQSQCPLRKPLLRKHFTGYVTGLMVQIDRRQLPHQGPTGGAAPIKNG